MLVDLQRVTLSWSIELPWMQVLSGPPAASAAGGFDLDQRLATVVLERLDVEARAIALIARDPSDLAHQVAPASAEQAPLLNLDNKLLTGLAEASIALITLGWIELSHQAL